MKKLFTKGTIALIVIFSVLIIDQIIKIWIKTHMYWHESIRVTDWFYIYFTENNGMAFGMEIFGKLFLTTFRIVAVALIGWYLYGLDGNDTDDTSPTYKVLEEGANTLSKEETTRLAQRQLKFIQGLQAALVRIENKTYGICRETGKLIPAERLRAVPHATLSIEAKNSGKK